MKIVDLQYIIDLNRIEELTELENSVWKIYNDMYDSQPWTTQQFIYPLLLKNKASKIIMKNERIYGFSIAYEYMSNWFHISRVAVKPDVSGKGLGKKLLKNQLNYFVNQRAKKCTVDLIAENLIACALYQSFGFNRLQGDELVNYITIRERNSNEYLGNNNSHIAMIKIFK